MTANEKAWRIARKHYGIPKFEKECRKTYEGKYYRRAYLVPGTAESGKHKMLCEQARHMVNRILKQNEKG